MDGNLRQLFRKHLPLFDWTSIETGMTGRGIPDSNFCCNGVEGWIEFKRTKGWAVDLRPEQIAWHMRRSRAGGRTFFAIRRQNTSRGATVDQLWLYPGAKATAVAQYGLRTPPLLQAAGGPARWPWQDVAAILGTP